MSHSSYQSARPFPSKCYCGIPPKIETSWTSPNPGRRFVACKFYDAMSEKKLMRAEIGNLKQEVCLLQDQKARLVAQNEKLSKKLRCTSMDGCSPSKTGCSAVIFYAATAMLILVLAKLLVA
uniref:Uncharacterized protein n=1 Tax=Chenopodium quinoa TaxID=63459 RepID=A0A803N9C0_CHEQI